MHTFSPHYYIRAAELHGASELNNAMDQLIPKNTHTHTHTIMYGMFIPILNDIRYIMDVVVNANEQTYTHRLKRLSSGLYT